MSYLNSGPVVSPFQLQLGVLHGQPVCSLQYRSKTKLFLLISPAAKKRGVMCRFMINWAMYDIQMEGLKRNAQTYQEPSTRAARQLVNFVLSFANRISAQHLAS
jgi:hypothetical protein